MFTRRPENAIAITLAAAVGILTGSCTHYQPSLDGSRLHMRLTGADSPEEIENMLKATLAEKYLHEDMTGSYRTYQITNGPSRWLIAQVANAPRGLSMYNLYCYEWDRSDVWLLRAYVPVNEHFLTNSLDEELKFQTDNEYVKVAFRGVVIFTITSSKDGNGVRKGVNP